MRAVSKNEMANSTYSRVWLPVVQLALAAVFGGVGISRRNQILNQVWLDQTLWHSTARFHVWPWPFKLAFILNLPAALIAAVVEWPLGKIWPNLPELIGWLLCLPFVAIL